MCTVTSLPTRGGSTASGAGAAMVNARGKKFLRAKRKSTGNNFSSNPNDESGRRKLIVYQKEILPPPCTDKNFHIETAPNPSKHLGYCGSGVLELGNKGFGGSKRLFDGKGDGRKYCRTNGNPGRNLVMEKVTILKRGTNMENFVAGRNSDEEEFGRAETMSAVDDGHGGFRVPSSAMVSTNHRLSSSTIVSTNPKGSTSAGVPVGSVDDIEKYEVSASVEKKPLKQPHLVRGYADKGQVKKDWAAAARVSQVRPVGSPDSTNWDWGGGCFVEKPVADVLVTRMGPEPNKVSKDVFEIARSVSSGSGSSETSSDNDDFILTVSSDSSVKSIGSPPSSPKDFMFDNMGDLNLELTVPSDAAWAGPACAKSPPPSWLPLPKFCMRNKARPGNVAEHNDLRAGRNANFVAPESPIQESKIELALPAGRCNANVNRQDGVNESKSEFALLVGQCNLNMNGQGGVDAFATRNLLRLLHLEI